MQCPMCRNHRIGILSSGRYFCADCAVEILLKDGQTQVFTCDEQGELKLLREFSEDTTLNMLKPRP